MTQWEYETIVKVIEGGAPALAETLIGSFDRVLQEADKASKENEDLKKQIKDFEEKSKDSADNPENPQPKKEVSKK